MVQYDNAFSYQIYPCAMFVGGGLFQVERKRSLTLK
jgi:hypothetical protein